MGPYSTKKIIANNTTPGNPELSLSFRVCPELEIHVATRNYASIEYGKCINYSRFEENCHTMGPYVRELPDLQNLGDFWNILDVEFRPDKGDTQKSKT